MSPVQTSQPGMQAAGQEFANRATEFTGLLKNVNTNMASLQGSWTGQASGAFNQAMDNWENSFKKVIDELIRMLDVMGATSTTYSQAEDDAAKTASSFAQALPGV